MNLEMWYSVSRVRPPAAFVCPYCILSGFGISFSSHKMRNKVDALKQPSDSSAPFSFLLSPQAHLSPIRIPQALPSTFHLSLSIGFHLTLCADGT